MKGGTFGIIGKVKKEQVELKLALCFQEKILRAVPLKTAGKEGMFIITPGKINKEEASKKILALLNEKFDVIVSKEAVLSAIPSEGFNIKPF